jgi:hypothetical protein
MEGEMAWTVIGKGTEGDVQGKSFGVSLETANKKWQAVGPDVDKFFTTRSGSYKVAGVPENGTQLVSPALAEVAFFSGLTGNSAVGSKGTGRASERGVNFEWKLDSK